MEFSNYGPCLGHAQLCGGAKPFNGIPITPIIGQQYRYEQTI